MEYSSLKSIRGLAHKLKTIQSTICRLLKKIGRVSLKILEITQQSSIEKKKQKTLSFPHNNARQESCRKMIGFRLVCSTLSYSADLAVSDFYLSRSQKISRITKNFLKITSKFSWKTFWDKTQVNFTLAESISYLINGKRRFKIMVKILLIEINSFLNYSWTNNILLKLKLFMTQPNMFLLRHKSADNNSQMIKQKIGTFIPSEVRNISKSDMSVSDLTLSFERDRQNWSLW